MVLSTWDARPDFRLPMPADIGQSASIMPAQSQFPDVWGQPFAVVAPGPNGYRPFRSDSSRDVGPPGRSALRRGILSGLIAALWGTMDQIDSDRRPLVSLFGAPVDTGNLGVSALGESILQGVAAHRPDIRMLVFDNQGGRRAVAAADGLPAHVVDGAWNSRRIQRPESLWTMYASARTGLPANRNVRALRLSDHVFDISGGDSFTDLYGPKRWQTVTLPKRITLLLDTPLTLLPQTYGPFRDPERRETARRIVLRAEQAWARDADSLDVLRDLLGDDFDPGRHRQGVDVAFALVPRRPALPTRLAEWLDEPGTAVGLNVSGLVMDPEVGRSQFGLTVDYPTVIERLARCLLEAGVDRLVLAPHVRGDFAESDDAACREIAARLDGRDRVAILPRGLGAGETKWCIGRLGWFCGTRMHSTIAALSSGVPSAAIAYSAKTRGVFATCGVAHAVTDARRETTTDAVDHLLESFDRRASDADVLASTVHGVVHRARAQFTQILDRPMAAGDAA